MITRKEGNEMAGENIDDTVAQVVTVFNNIERRMRHKKQHRELHAALDELIADWIGSSDRPRPSKNTVYDLMKWSAKQIENPDHE